MSEVKAALEEASWDEGMVQLLAVKAEQARHYVLASNSISAAEGAYQALRKKGLAAVSKKVNICVWILVKSAACLTFACQTSQRPGCCRHPV